MERLEEVKIKVESEFDRDLKDAISEPPLKGKTKVEPKKAAGQKVFTPYLR